MLNRMDKKIKREYLNPNIKGSFSGLENFLKNSGNRYSRKQVTDALNSIPAYTENRPAHSKFKRRKVFVHGIDHQWVCDLVEISKKNIKDNNNYKYLFTCMDAFSKYAWIAAMKNKKSTTTLRVFKDIIKKSGRICKSLQSDMGSEFKGVFSAFLKSKNINYFHVYSELKCSLIERFNRTIMDKVERFLIHQRKSLDKKKRKQPNRFIHVLPLLLKNYNSSIHRSTKFRPIDVNETNSMSVWLNLYGSEPLKSEGKSKFNVGDKCLISILKNQWEKGYSKKFKPEVFTVDRVGDSFPRMYYLKDAEGEDLKGGFYSQELSRVTYN